jgi:exopolyphosphatase
MKVDIFIKQSKLLFNQLGKKLRIVIGNQSADLDSIVSAISLEFYLNQVDAEKNFIPIINSSKSIIATKKPWVYLFQHLSFHLEDLLFIGYLKRDRLKDVFQRIRRTRD